MRLFSNEIVFRGHPDKVCDQISDALVDEFIKGDKKSRCAIETMGGKGKIFITGEVTSKTVLRTGQRQQCANQNMTPHELLYLLVFSIP